MNLVREEPLPADALPLAIDDQLESTTGDTDGGERLFQHHKALQRRTLAIHFFNMSFASVVLLCIV